MTHSPLPILALLAAALSGVIAWTVADHRPPPQAQAVVPVAPAALAAASRPNDPGTPAQTILARPLFDPARRPPPVVAAGSGASEPPPRLTALIAGPFGRRAILVMGEQSRTVEAGAVLGEWTVTSIGATSVAVAGRDGKHTLMLTQGPPAPPPPPPAEEPDEHGTGAAIRLPSTPAILDPTLR